MRKSAMGSNLVRFAGAIVLLSCFVIGCGGDGFSRVPVSGMVSCEGNTDVNGSILASPATEGTGSPNVGAPIQGGKFSFVEGESPVAGSYMFEIGVQTGSSEANEDGEIETGPEVLYRKTVEIPEGGTSSLSIELTAADRVGDE